jgi:hypothetical protein
LNLKYLFSLLLSKSFSNAFFFSSVPKYFISINQDTTVVESRMPGIYYLSSYQSIYLLSSKYNKSSWNYGIHKRINLGTQVARQTNIIADRETIIKEEKKPD